tara:strand:- start:14 stop:1168 length:1155 start_codon:yes stop_codon:yes gene_type:complete
MTEDHRMPLGQHWLIAIMLCVSGIGFGIAMGSSTIAQISTENWEEGTGIVEDFEIICYEQEDSSCSWEENIIYTYNVNGQSYTNTEISLAWRVPEYAADRYESGYYIGYGWGIKEGDEIDVFYNPQQPSRSVLLRGWEGIDFGDFIILGFSTIIPMIVLITARKKGKLTDAIGQWREIFGPEERFTTNYRDNPNVEAWVNQSYEPTNHESISYSQYGISPSRMRGYNSAIAYLSLNDSMDENTVKTLVESNFGISANDAAKFVQSTYVKAILFSNSNDNDGQTPSLPSTLPTEPMSKNLISEDQSSSQQLQNQLISNFQIAMQEAMDTQEKPPSANPPVDPNKEACSHPSCKNAVSFYSFQCFSCRKKFCDEHRGASIHCADCA